MAPELQIGGTVGISMQGYRAYVVGQDGRTLGRTEFSCADDEAAKQRAKQLADGNDVECGGTTAKSQSLRAQGPPTPPFDAREPD